MSSLCCSSNTTCTWSSGSRAISSCSWAARFIRKVRRRKFRRIPACARSISGRASMAEPLLSLHKVTGRYGVGKSTLLLTIMGFTHMHGGRLTWRGQDISRLPPHRRAAGGIGWVAQEREIFPSLSVEENLTVASRPGAWNLAMTYKLFPRLAERRRNMGHQLSGGEQQMLAIARALMT